MALTRIILTCIIAVIIIFPATGAMAKDEGYTFGTEVYYFNYEEPDFMEDKGVFWGLNGSYTNRFSGFNVMDPAGTVDASQERTMLRLDARWAVGRVDYTSVNTGDLDGITDYVFETRGVLGIDVDTSEKCGFTPYIGLGYRYLYDDTSGMTTTTGARGYQRESNYFYLPIGADIHGRLNDNWEMLINLEFDLFLYGRQKSYLGDAVAGLNTIENDQEEGYGLRGSVRLTNKGQNRDFFIEPFIRYWHVDDSDISSVTYNGVLVGYGLEPENKTFEIGAKIGLMF